MGQEKRSYQRFSFNRPAQCAFFDSFPKSFPVKIVDIGPEGVGFISDRKITFGTDAYLMIDLRQGVEIKFIIKTRHSQALPNTDEYHTGAKIVDANQKDLQRFIRTYYRQMVPTEEGKRKVLVVISERAFSRRLQAKLVRFNYDCVCAFDGEEGVKMYIAEHPDLIIMDSVVPKLDAYAAVRKIRRILQDARTPIIMLAGKKAEAAKVMKDNIGVQECLVKPVEMDELLGAVEQQVYL